MKLLLVEPPFPVADKSKNHAHFLPVGLLKIGSYHKSQGDSVKLVRGLKPVRYKPERVLITSLFTYWSSEVHEAAAYYHDRFPDAAIEIGGVYASLMPEDCKRRSPFALVKVGLYKGGVAENVMVDYALLPEELDYQIIHTSRGCTRKCNFCGTWRIEPKLTFKSTVKDEVQKRRLIFYDNNLLANPHIGQILEELAAYRPPGARHLSCESQSGFDLRLLTEEMARKLREAHFVYPRIAWDGKYDTWPVVLRAVRMLRGVGYGRKEVFMFMLYNHTIPYLEMMKKLDACRRWQVRVIDCRFRPLTSTTDGYVPGPKTQPPESYYIHKGWTDTRVRRFRRAVRRQNIAILLNLPNGRYVDGCEMRKV